MYCYKEYKALVLTSTIKQTNFVFIPVPFDEEDKDRDVWFFDHEYLENMYGMVKKVNGKLVHRFCFVLIQLLTSVYFNRSN